MVEMTCEEHDQLAASTQFITHTVGRMLGAMQVRAARAARAPRRRAGVRARALSGWPAQAARPRWHCLVQPACVPGHGLLLLLLQLQAAPH